MSLLSTPRLREMYIPYSLEVGIAPAMAHDHGPPACEAKIMLLFNATHGGLTTLAKPIKIMSVTSGMLTSSLSRLFPDSPSESPASSSPASPIPSYTLAGAFKDINTHLNHGHTKPKNCRSCDKCRALAEVIFTLQQGFSALSRAGTDEERHIYELAASVGEACVKKYDGFFGALISPQTRPESAPATTNDSCLRRTDKRRRFSSSVTPRDNSKLPEGMVTVGRWKASSCQLARPLPVGFGGSSTDQLFPVPMEEPTTPENSSSVTLLPKTPRKTNEKPPRVLDFSKGNTDQRENTKRD